MYSSINLRRGVWKMLMRGEGASQNMAIANEGVGRGVCQMLIIADEGW